MDTHVRCRPGDLALVVHALNPENIGQLVEVLSAATGQPFKLKEQGHAWQVRCPGGHAGLHYRYRDGRMFVSNEGPALDSALQPIRGPATGSRAAPRRTEREGDVEPLISVCWPQLP